MRTFSACAIFDIVSERGILSSCSYFLIILRLRLTCWASCSIEKPAARRACFNRPPIIRVFLFLFSVYIFIIYRCIVNLCLDAVTYELIFLSAFLTTSLCSLGFTLLLALLQPTVVNHLLVSIWFSIWPFKTIRLK